MITKCKNRGGILRNTNKKGFTLIELLAVIVILAIIALIATPIILNMINDAKKSAAKDSAYGYIEAIEYNNSMSQIDSKKYPLIESGEVTTLDVKVKGTPPTKGNVTITNGRVTEANLCINNYSVHYDGKEAKIKEKCNLNNTVLLIIGEKKEKQTTTSLTTTFNIDENLDNYTNIVCNNGATPSLENNILTVNNIFSNTTCIINNNLEDTINNLDNSENSIVMIKDEEISNTLKINKNQNVIFDLNGKTIKSDIYETYSSKEYDGTKGIFSVQEGKLIINDSIGTGKLLTSSAMRTVESIKNGYLEINGGYFEGRQSVGASSGEVVINDGEFTTNTYSSITNYKNGIITINGGKFHNDKQYQVYNSSDGIININGGIFISDISLTIVNYSTGTININQTDKPIYMSSLANKWSPVIENYSSGTINIKANKADNCTINSSDTTSGLCVYTEGDRNYNDITSNVAVYNANSGAINIDGGTYFGGRNGINSGTNGNIINIKNAKVTSGAYPILNNGTNSIINICNSQIVSLNLKQELVNNSTGTINYSSSVIFTNGTNTPNVNNSNGIINADYTGICTN